MEQVQLIRAPLGKSLACIAFETWSRMNSKPRNPEIKVTVTKPSKSTKITKFEDCSLELQNNLIKFAKSRYTVKEFANTLGKKAKELSEEEKLTRENLVNHLMQVDNMAETVEMELPKRLVEKKKPKKNEKENEKEKERGKRDYDEEDDKDTIEDFDDTAFPELMKDHPAVPAVPAVPAGPAIPAVSENLFNFKENEENEELEEEEDNDDDNETVNSKFNVAIEARKRHVGKITANEFKSIFQVITNDILKENFRLDPNGSYEETILRTCITSDLFWSNLFTRINQVLEEEQSQKVDDKLVLYIRNQKK